MWPGSQIIFQYLSHLRRSKFTQWQTFCQSSFKILSDTKLNFLKDCQNFHVIGRDGVVRGLRSRRVRRAVEGLIRHEQQSRIEPWTWKWSILSTNYFVKILLLSWLKLQYYAVALSLVISFWCWKKKGKSSHGSFLCMSRYLIPICYVFFLKSMQISRANKLKIVEEVRTNWLKPSKTGWSGQNQRLTTR